MWLWVIAEFLGVVIRSQFDPSWTPQTRRYSLVSPLLHKEFGGEDEKMSLFLFLPPLSLNEHWKTKYPSFSSSPEC